MGACVLVIKIKGLASRILDFQSMCYTRCGCYRLWFFVQRLFLFDVDVDVTFRRLVLFTVYHSLSLFCFLFLFLCVSLTIDVVCVNAFKPYKKMFP